MLPRSARLRRSDDIARVRQEGQRWQHPLITLFVATQPQDLLSVSRFAFAAGRYVGKATVRNRAKRRLREIVRQNLDQIQPGRDCLFVARPATPTADFGDLERAALQLLTRAGLWRDHRGRSSKGSPL